MAAAAFSVSLDAAISRAFDEAETRRHAEVTPEHLLLALLHDIDAVSMLIGCRFDYDWLRAAVTEYLDLALPKREGRSRGKLRASEALERAVQRAMIYVAFYGPATVTCRDVLIALFAEADSPAAALLKGTYAFRRVRYFQHDIAPIRPAINPP
jgi:ATP-dependent Clp protease ATP-binding subunit ClpA